MPNRFNNFCFSQIAIVKNYKNKSNVLFFFFGIMNSLSISNGCQVVIYVIPWLSRAELQESNAANETESNKISRKKRENRENRMLVLCN